MKSPWSESRMRENRTSGLMSGGVETGLSGDTAPPLDSTKHREQRHDQRFRAAPRSYSPTRKIGLSNKKAQKISKGSGNSVPLVRLIVLMEKQRLQRFLVLLSATSARSTSLWQGPRRRGVRIGLHQCGSIHFHPTASKDRGRLSGQTVNMRRLLKSREDRIMCSDSISSVPFCNLTRMSCEISGLEAVCDHYCVWFNALRTKLTRMR